MREFVQKEKLIGGTKFVVTRFHAKEGFQLQAFLAARILPPIAQIMGALDGLLSVKKSLGDLKFDGDKIAQAIEKLLGFLGEDEYLALIHRMLQKTVAHIDGKQYSFVEHFDASLDIVFGGRTFDIFPVLLLVMEANFPDFLSALPAIGKKIQTTLSSELPEDEMINESGNSETSED